MLFIPFLRVELYIDLDLPTRNITATPCILVGGNSFISKYPECCKMQTTSESDVYISEPQILLSKNDLLLFDKYSEAILTYI